jgi:plasmid stability protein
MAQLVVRKLEETVVQELRKRAAKAGVSMEEEHRRILREALRGSRKVSFKDQLLSIPVGSGDDVFERKRTVGRGAKAL